MKLSLPVFSGIRPKISADNIGAQEAQTAENCKLWNGNLRPWYNYSSTQLLVKRGIVKKVYLYEDTYWLEWEAEVDLIEAPIAGDTDGKIFWTGAGVPMKSERDEIITGSGAMPISYYPLAVPTPLAALSGVVGGPPNGSGDDRYVTYVWTTVSAWGEESYPSPASSTYTAADGERIALSAMTMIWVASTAYTKANSVYETADEGGTYLYKCVTAGTTGGTEPTWNQTVGGYTLDGTVVWQCFENNISYKRIYRLEVGDSYANYSYVDQIASSATTYNDDKTVAELNEACPSLNIDDGGNADEDWDPPDDGLLGITYLGNGIALGYKGKDWYASVPYKMWAWPSAYSGTLPESIVSITSAGLGTAVISTNRGIYIAQGTAPASIIVDPLPDSRPNVSKRSAVPYLNGAVYAAADGLRYADASTNRNLTNNHYSVDEWSALYPSTMHGVIHDNKYFGFYSSGGNEGGIVVDLSSGMITTLDFYCFATYVDPSTDTLYFLRSTAMSIFSEIWTNPDAASASGKATQYDLTGGAGVMASLVQPDYARNAVLTLTDANASITAISITIAGTNSEGESTTETFSFSDFTALTATGNIAWAEITSVTINSVTGAGAGDALDLGHGVKFGLGNTIAASTDVIKVNEDNDDSGVDDLTISTTYNTVTFETAPNATHDYQIWYSA